MRISDWSSDVCSSDLSPPSREGATITTWATTMQHGTSTRAPQRLLNGSTCRMCPTGGQIVLPTNIPELITIRHFPIRSSKTGVLSVSRTLASPMRSEEHTSELQSLMRISYAVFCLIKQNHNKL